MNYKPIVREAFKFFMCITEKFLKGINHLRQFSVLEIFETIIGKI